MIRSSPPITVSTIRHKAVVDNDLYAILKALFDAGAQDVLAEDLPWKPQSTAVIVHALNMLYMVRRDYDGASYFSLTASGYRAIGETPPVPASFMGFVRAMFRR